jgi:hypothetical protein
MDSPSGNWNHARSSKQKTHNGKHTLKKNGNSQPVFAAEASMPSMSGPQLLRNADGTVDYDSLPDVIQWFLDYDQRVSIIKHPRVEELFQWKQEQSRLAGEEVINFNRAEDRVAIGIIQSVAHNPTEQDLHTWIAQLLNALNRASKATEDVSSAYQLDLTVTSSVVSESQKIPTQQVRSEFLIDCWIEALCTAEIRVLGWLYLEFYGRPFRPDNF